MKIHYPVILSLLAIFLGACRLTPPAETPPVSTLPPSEVPPTAGPPTPTLTPTPIPLAFPDQCLTTYSYWLRNSGEDRIGPDHAPSPDKKYDVYQQGQKVILEEVATGKTQLLTDGYVPLPWGVRWSPHSDQVAFTSNVDFYQYHRDYDVVILDLSQGIDSARRVTVPPAQDTNQEVTGWSPDGGYLVITAFETMIVPRQVTIWSVRDGKFTYVSQTSPHMQTVRELAWSPDSRWLAYLWEGIPGSPGEPPGYWLTMVNAATGGETTRQEAISEVDAFYASLLWSADSLGVALVFGQRIEVFQPGVDRSIRVLDVPDLMTADPVVLAGSLPELHFPFVSWQADSRALLIWNHPGIDRFRLDRLSVDRPQLDTIMTVQRPPFPAPAPLSPAVAGRLAIYSGDEHRYRIDVMSADGSGRVPFVVDAYDAGNPDWSPGGEAVAAVWATETAGRRLVRLSWASAQGGQYHVVEGDYLDIRNLRWSPDGQILTFIGVREDGAFSVEMADIRTGEHHVLLDGLKDVIYPRYDDAGAYYTTRWRTLAGQEGYDGYDKQGVRLFRVVVEGDVSRSSELFFSPDRQVAAVKVRLPDQEKLALARTDGSPPVIARAGLSGLGDPLWSPDSRLVAFTQSIQRGPVTWQIVGADGQDVWSLPPARPGAEYVWGNLAWAECAS